MTYSIALEIGVRIHASEFDLNSYELVVFDKEGDQESSQALDPDATLSDYTFGDAVMVDRLMS